MSSDRPPDSLFKRWTKKYNRFRHSNKATDRGDEPAEEAYVLQRPLGQVTNPLSGENSERPETDAAEPSAAENSSTDTVNAGDEENEVAASNDVSEGQPTPSKDLSLWDKAFHRITTSNADHEIVATIQEFCDRLTLDQRDPAESIAKDIKRLMEQTIVHSETNPGMSAWKIKINGTEYSVRRFVDKTVGILNRFASVGDVISSFDPGHAALPWAAVRSVLITLTAQSKLNGDIAFGLAKITTLIFQCDIYQNLYQASRSSYTESYERILSDLEETIVEIYSQSLLFFGFIIRQYQSIGIAAIFKLDDMDKQNQDLLRLGDKLSQAADNCEKYCIHQNQENVEQVLKLARESHQTIHDQGTVLLDIQKYTLLSNLNHAKGAAYDLHANENDPRCHPDTRVDLLNEIQTWASNDTGETIFWLQGMAGTGKSTIARTVAERLDRRGELGASFFFKRGEGDCGRAAYFFSTISQQLCQRIPSFAQYVQQAIEVDASITEKPIFQQFQKLILEPLREANRNNIQGSKILVVIDALDECDREEDAKRIISLLSQSKDLGPMLRFFLTSRPEYHIRLGFGQIEERSHKDVALHKISHAVVEQDIATYLVYKLAIIREDYNRLTAYDLQLPREWPSSEQIWKLVSMATPLFIVAATFCRLLEDMAPSNPTLELTKLLTLPAGTSDEKLTATYLPVLEHLLIGKTGSKKAARQRVDIVAQFQDIIGPLVLLAEPLSVTSLAVILGIDRHIVDGIVNSLHSVLSVPSEPNAPVRAFHLSFCEFLVNKEGNIPDEFWVNKEETNKRLANKCLELLSKDGNLRYNICDLNTLGEPKSNILDEKLQSALLPEVQYACLYWVVHLKEGKVELDDQHQVYAFLQEHFLHWLEALSFMNRISESIRLTLLLQSIVNPDTGIHTLEFLHDARRFILRFQTIVSHAPLQLYSSALVFAPHRSVVRETFKEHISWITQQPCIESDWSPCLQILEDHHDSVLSVAFSSNCKLLASASADSTVKVWDTSTGELQTTFNGHTDEVKSITFSSDDTLIASGSGDTTLKVWDISTGELHWTFRGHTKTVDSVIFLGAESLIASASWDAIKIWDLATSNIKLTLEGRDGGIKSITYSSLGRLIASGSTNKKIHLWDATTGELKRILQNHGNSISTLAFSPDSTRILSVSHKEVQILDTQTGALCGVHHCFCDPVAFSVDRELVASASAERFDVVISSIETEEFHQALEGHTDWVVSAAISPNSELAASGSLDSTIRIWDITKESSVKVPEAHWDEVSLVTFSPDSRLLASASLDGYIMVWDAKTGGVQYLLLGHSNDVNYHPKNHVGVVVFSPDSKLVASISFRGAVKIWEAAQGRLCGSFRAANTNRYLESAVFSSDSKLLKVAEFWQQDRISVKRRVLDVSRFHPTYISASSEGLGHSFSDSLKDISVQNEDNTEASIQIPGRASGSQKGIGARSNQWADKSRPQTYSLDRNRTWIQKDGQNLLWIPHEYRPRDQGSIQGAVPGSSNWDITSTATSNRIGMGSISGKVIIIGFEDS